jgi:hypothetical protein
LDFHFFEVLVVGLSGRRALRCAEKNPKRFGFQDLFFEKFNAEAGYVLFDFVGEGHITSR